MRERRKRWLRSLVTPSLLWPVPVLVAAAGWLAMVAAPLAVATAAVLGIVAAVLVVWHVNSHPLRYEHTTELGFTLVMIGGLGVLATVLTAIQASQSGAGAWESATVALVLGGSGFLIGLGLLTHDRLPLGKPPARS